MKVHITDGSGQSEIIECEAIREADNGIYLLSRPSSKLREVVGYVPYDNLEYVSPVEGDE